MGAWYKVTKKINGRLYDYWQRTERVGGSVKTYNIYIGPSAKVAAYGEQYAITKKNNVVFMGADREREARRIASQEKAAMRAPGVDDPNDIRHVIHGANTMAYEHATKVTPVDQYERTVAEHRQQLDNYQPRPVEPDKTYPEPEYSKEELREVRALERERKKEFDAGMNRQAAKVRAAKQNSRGSGAVNPFLGQAMKSRQPAKAAPTNKASVPYFVSDLSSADQAAYDAMMQGSPKSDFPAKPTSFPVRDQANCKHEAVYHAGANPGRGAHDRHCKHCGMDMSYDSSD